MKFNRTWYEHDLFVHEESKKELANIIDNELKYSREEPQHVEAVKLLKHLRSQNKRYNNIKEFAITEEFNGFMLLAFKFDNEEFYYNLMTPNGWIRVAIDEYIT